MKAAMQIIRDADRGQLLTDMQFGLDDIANAIEKNGGGVGEITLSFKIKPKAAGAYEIASKLDIKIPQPSRLPAIMFREEDSGEFTRRDPRQPDLPVVVEADFRNGTNPKEDA